jgi:hypothetical protein
MSLLGIVCWSPLWGCWLLGVLSPRVRANRVRRAATERQRRRLRDETIRRLEREMEIELW